MDKTKSLSVGGLILGTFLLSRDVGSSFALDKPVHSSIVLLSASALLLLLCSRLLPKDTTRTVKGRQYDAVPLSEIGQPHASREPSPTPDGRRYPSSLRKLRICFFLLICAVCARAASARYIVVNIQCTTVTWEPLIPLVLVAYDYWTAGRHKRASVYMDPAVTNGSAYDELPDEHVGQPRYRYVYAALFLGCGSLIGLSAASGPSSTYICASTLSNHWMVPLTQRMGTALDIGILYCVTELLLAGEGPDTRSFSSRFASVAWALLSSAVALFAYGSLYTTFMTTPIQRKRILEITPVYAWSLATLTTFTAFTVTSACIAIHKVGLTTVSFITVFVCVCTWTTTHAWNNTYAFPPVSSGLLLLGFSLTVIGLVGYLHYEATQHDKLHRVRRLFKGNVPIWLWLALLALCLVRFGLWAGSSSRVSYHPVDLLIYDAQLAHDTYVNKTSDSSSLAEAVSTYRQRYNRHPPPGFDHWYTFATERNSLVIDDFDSIHEDLLPFWALSAQQIRDRTWQMISNPWHDASSLSIRNGKVEVSPSEFIMPTHAWMLEGLMKMIGNFAEWLPDMDLAFNVNDECRVAVPFEIIEAMRESAEHLIPPKANTVRGSFSPERAAQWTPLPGEPSTDRVMRELSWQKTFNVFGASGCSPESAARTQRHVDLGQLCTSCIGPHSMGAFLANWTLANNVCHQPDMARLHGIYVAPAAFKASHELYPIFSQSKVHGFNDILYPSAWNYISKAQYDPKAEFPDPPFAEKNSSLFWRGATSEGFSFGSGQWKGMARQRFVYLANGVNATSSVPHTVLTPYTTASGEQKLSYENVAVSELMRLLPTDVHVVESIARCGGKDCPEQAREFAPLVEPTDFQAHWRYKYLLDLDGAGFSGRFLPFLQSHSLPFKAAVFREWWDDRVTAWQHFVPLDVRGHGFWATLAYFAGSDGQVNGRPVKLEAHEREAERIAENGREWAGKVLRKEDMEIYFFRLLLEWGRLTDDKRDEIGYVVDGT